MKPKSLYMVEEFFKRNANLSFNQNVLISLVEDLMANRGKVIFTCGNGGSASDSEHIVGELMKGFMLDRKLDDDDTSKFTDVYGVDEGKRLSDNLQYGIPSVSLVSSSALMTAFSNDVDPEMVFAQQVYGLGREGDYLIGISASGNSKNVAYAAKTAKIKGLKVIGLTSQGNNRLTSIADYLLLSPEKEVYRIQEDHIKLYHLLCAVLESEYFG